MSKSDNLEPLFEKLEQGDIASFARFLSQLERNGASKEVYKRLLAPKKPALRIGITGPPGAGKSTLVGKLIGKAREQGLKVGVMAVDPSSPFTNGAILADRIRYTEYSLDPEVFIRSLGTRGSLGGLSASAYLMARAFDLCDFDLLLIETVGVGQSELEIVDLADRVAIVLVPESGDAVQAMKAGLLEISDLFVINKSDRPGADLLENELQTSMELAGSQVEVFKTIASQGDGVDELFQRFLKPLDKKELEKRNSERRLKAEARAKMRKKVEEQISQELQGVQTQESFLQWLELMDA